MKKVLVPTDFSASSKSGILFAINWATRQKLELIFTHVLYILRPTRWSDANFEKYVEKEKRLCRARLEAFIATVYENRNMRPGKHSFLVMTGTSPDIAILDYCGMHRDVDYICISTRGAGKFKKIFGTNTGNLITKSEVPVLAVPKTFKVSDITKLLYATDFRNYQEELTKVIGFASPLKAKIEVLHFNWPALIPFDEKTLESASRRQYKYGLQIHFKTNDAVLPLVHQLQTEIRKSKPSVVVMFTNQNRTFFQKLFLSSSAEDLSFRLSVPLLVFSKNSGS